MKRFVLDASALVTFFENRPGAAKILELIRFASQGRYQLWISVVNWGEIYYSTWRLRGPGVARKILADIEQLPLEVCSADSYITRLTAELRANHKLHYTDCFAAALAIERQATLATSDQDFVAIQKKIDILWAT